MINSVKSPGYKFTTFIDFAKHLSSLMHFIFYHSYTVYLACFSNLGDIILSGFLFGTVNSLIAPQFSMGPALSISQIFTSRRAPLMLLWSWCNIFLFCLHNQRSLETIAEDKLNKPWRPIPAGRLTPGQAKQILYFMHPLCFLVGLKIGGFWPYVILVTFHVWYNEFGGASNPILKNVHNGVGVCCFLAGPLEVATGRSVFSGKGDAAIWLLILTATLATACHTQDFRDVEGDKAAGRRTVPLVIGDLPARLLVAIMALVWTLVACVFWGVWREGILPLAAGLIMVGNLFLRRNRMGDIHSWRLFTVWLQALVAVPVLKSYRSY